MFVLMAFVLAFILAFYVEFYAFFYVMAGIYMIINIFAMIGFIFYNPADNKVKRTPITFVTYGIATSLHLFIIYVGHFYMNSPFVVYSSAMLIVLSAMIGIIDLVHYSVNKDTKNEDA